MWYLTKQGSNQCPFHWKHGVLTTRLPGNSLIIIYWKKKKVTQINSKWESIHLEFSSEKRQKINDVRWYRDHRLIDSTAYWVWWLLVRNYTKDHRGYKWLTVFKVRPLHPKEPWKGRKSPHYKLHCLLSFKQVFSEKENGCFFINFK